MIPKYFEHFTLNTGHNMRQHYRKFDNGLDEKGKQWLCQMAKAALSPPGAEVCPGVIFRAFLGTDSYFGTVYWPDVYGLPIMPYLHTVGVKTEEAGSAYMEMLQDDFSVLEMHPELPKPKAPYVADVLVSPNESLELSAYTGVFCFCIGWALLYPECLIDENGKALSLPVSPRPPMLEYRLRLGRTIQDFRKMHGMSQDEAADKAGIPCQYLAEIENPSLDTRAPVDVRLAIGKAVGTPFGMLL